MPVGDYRWRVGPKQLACIQAGAWRVGGPPLALPALQRKHGERLSGTIPAGSSDSCSGQVRLHPESPLFTPTPEGPSPTSSEIDAEILRARDREVQRAIFGPFN